MNCPYGCTSREREPLYCWYRSQQSTSITALTACVLEEEKAIVLSAGCDVLRKPFAGNTIFDTLAKCLGVKYIFAENNFSNCEYIE